MKPILTKKNYNYPTSSTTSSTPQVAVNKVNLTPRDHALLRWIGQVQVASLSQLHFQLWSQTVKPASLKAACNRLSQLVGAGYLEGAPGRRPRKFTRSLTKPGKYSHRQSKSTW